MASEKSALRYQIEDRTSKLVLTQIARRRFKIEDEHLEVAIAKIAWTTPILIPIEAHAVHMRRGYFQTNHQMLTKAILIRPVDGWYGWNGWHWGRWR